MLLNKEDYRPTVSAYCVGSEASKAAFLRGVNLVNQSRCIIQYQIWQERFYLGLQCRD